MEAAQERELQLLQVQVQGSSWPFYSMEAASSSWNASSSGGSGCGDCFLLGWEPPFGCLGVVAAAGADIPGLFPLHMEDSPASLPPAPPQQEAVALPLPEELDDLLLNFWDASEQQQQQQQQVAFNSSCILQEKTSSTATATTTTNSNSSFYDDDDLLGSIFSTGPTLPEKGVAEPLSSSSSNCQADPQVSHVSGAQPQATPAPGGAWAPPCPARSSSSSLKRAAPEGDGAGETAAEAEYCSQSSKRRRETSTSPAKAAAPVSACRVLCPFAVLKPDGLDGGATIADINARILMRPSRPVRHPVGEFACAPRVSADKPGLSGKTVSGFTRLHTPGRGIITIIRTRG